MASSSSTPFNPSPIFFLFLLSSMLVSCTSSANALKDKNMQTMTHLHFYFHEVYEGLPNPTSFVVVPSVDGGNPSSFGEIRVFDNALREGPETSSKLVGRAQGMVVQESLGAQQAILSTINFVLTDQGMYNGSSVALFGRADGAVAVNDRSIVGGTGQFRLARGYALSKVVNYTSLSVVVEFDVYVLQV